MTGNNSKGKSLFVSLLVTVSLFLFLTPVYAAGSVYYYQVQPGDYLWLIGWKFEQTVDSISSYNRLNTTQVYPGQGLMIPESTGYVRELPKLVQYTAKKGDTLYLIAQRFNTSVSKIKELNKLTSDSIWIGQSLYIPLPTQKRYTVQKGDTLYIVAQKFNGNIDALMLVNKMTTQTLWIGQVLFVPDNGTGTTQPPADGTQTPGTGTTQPPTDGTQTPGTDTTQPPTDGADNSGDDQNAGVGTLPPINTIDFSKPLPVIGQWGQIPSGIVLYRVQPGDNLWLLAQRYHTSQGAISLTNHLHSDIIQINQPLFIPQNSTQPISISSPAGLNKEGYGELMDWQFASWLLDTGSIFTIQDVATGKSFKVKRYGGSNHLDAEPLTSTDSAIMNSIYAGQWSWSTRPVLVYTDGKVLAGSIAGMPHSYDSIPDNNFAGHFDLYFLNSTSHNTNELNPDHQKNILKAAGY